MLNQPKSYKKLFFIQFQVHKGNGGNLLRQETETRTKNSLRIFNLNLWAVFATWVFGFLIKLNCLFLH